jgi:alkanesulfonate monooxygenase SsuD/methylene tetrahydromethanopterin reductase-like flavin-dependent oxidoreductase (luciferase family)
VERGLRFGVITIQGVPWPTLAERWQYLDELGLNSAWVADHFTNSSAQAEP